MAEKKQSESGMPAAQNGSENTETPRVVVRTRKKSSVAGSSGRKTPVQIAPAAHDGPGRKTPSTVSAKTSAVRPLLQSLATPEDEAPGRQPSSAANTTSRASAYGRFLKTHANATHRRRPAALSEGYLIPLSLEEVPGEDAEKAAASEPVQPEETAQAPVEDIPDSGSEAVSEPAAPLAEEAPAEAPDESAGETESAGAAEPAGEAESAAVMEPAGEAESAASEPQAEEAQAGEPAPAAEAQPDGDIYALRFQRTNFPDPSARPEAAAPAPETPAEVPSVDPVPFDEFENRLFRDFHNPESLTAPLEEVKNRPADAETPVTMSTEAMARTQDENPREAAGGSFRGLVENLQGAAATESEPAPAAAPAPAAHAGAPRVLICWIGKVDIGAALRHDQINPGPVRMLLERMERFDHIILLTPQNQNVEDLFRDWLSACADEKSLEFRRTGVRDLSDHALICSAVMDVVDEAIMKYGLPADGTGITFHLSPGSPATHAVLMLLAADRYRGIRLVQTKLPGIGQRPEVLSIEVPAVALKPAAAGDRMPVSASAQPEEQAYAAASPDEHAHQRPGRGSRYLHRRSAGRGFEQERTDDVISEPYDSIRKPTTAPNMQAQPQDGEPPTISEALGRIYSSVQRIASMPLPVLLMGEDGTGKSRLARFVHEWSGRGGKYVSIECSGLTDAMFTSELFGQKAGDYPGAWRSREGAFRLANGGTVFLENVDMLTPSQQAILLRVLSPSGETVVVLPGQGPRQGFTSRVRIVASASERVLQKLHSGEFRPALFYRLAGVCAELPAVRSYTPEERQNLLRSLLVRLQHRLGVCWNFNGDAWQALVEEEWPGNLRELTRMMQQICLMAPADGTITRDYVLKQLKLARTTAPEKTVSAPAPAAAPEPAAPHQSLPGFTAMELPFPGAPADEAQHADAAEALAPEHGSADDFELGGGIGIDDWLRQLRLKKVQEAMEKTNGNRREAASLLGMSYIQLNYTLRQMKNKEEGEEEEEK